LPSQCLTQGAAGEATQNIGQIRDQKKTIRAQRNKIRELIRTAATKDATIARLQDLVGNLAEELEKRKMAGSGRE
jgi:hypothetical protein